MIRSLSLFLATALAASPTLAQDYLLNNIYVAPGPVAIDGGVSPANRHIAPNDPFVTDYVMKRPIKTDWDDSVTIAIGGRLHDQIRLHDIPTTPYAYASVNEVTVLTDRNRQRIIKIFP